MSYRVSEGNTIPIDRFKEKIGWTPSNWPHSDGCLKLIDGKSVANVNGARISGNHFSIHYKYDIIANEIYFPIVFMCEEAGLVVNNEQELDDWAGKRFSLSCMKDKVEVKKEYMKGRTEKEIRQDEVRHKDRLPFSQIYDYDTDDTIGYKYIEI